MVGPYRCIAHGIEKDGAKLLSGGLGAPALPAGTPQQAAAHPNWAMGQRITIDSASMFNKALEVIEAHEFFGLPGERIEVLVHPESIVHALVSYIDGGTLAHLGPPDMRHAIGHALHWPDRAALPVAALEIGRAHV